MIPSPYTPGAGVRPRALTGRSELLEDAQADLSRVRMTGEAGSQVTVFTGSRGLGKTVLLYTIADQAQRMGFATAHVAFDDTPHALQRIAEQVGRAMLGNARTKAAKGRLASRLAQFSVEVSAAGLVKVGTEWRREDAARATARDQLTELIIEAATAERRQAGTGLVLTLDEVQDCPREQLAGIAHVIQDVTRQQAPLIVFAAGLAHTPETVMAAASFAERFHYVELERLDDRAALLALLNPALDLGVSWSTEAARLVLHESAGSPYLIQRFGDDTWRAARPTGPGQFSLDHARSGVAHAERRLNQGLYRGRWQLATASERELLAAIASNLNQDGVATMSAVAATLGKATTQLSYARQRLIDKGLIESPGFNRIGFTMPGFERFVLQQAKASPEIE